MNAALFAWRNHVVSSGLPSTTRHVLLTLSMYMNEHGDSCFPSVRRLEYETGLSRRTVCTHLESASKLGWIIKQDAGRRGQSWRSNSYVGTIPKGAKIITYDQMNSGKFSEKGGEPNDIPTGKGGEPNAEGGEPNDIKVVKEVPLISSFNTPYNSEPGATESDQPKSVPMKSRHDMLNAIAVLFNEHLPAHTKTESPQPFNHHRQDRLREIIRERPDFANLGMWEWLFSGIDELDFWNGRDKEKKFRRGFDYFLKPETLTQMIESVNALEEDVTS